MDKILANSQLNYEIGVMMFRAFTTTNNDDKQYNINDNFIGIIEDLNNHFIFDKDIILCGFENEYEDTYNRYDREDIQNLFKSANVCYKLNYN